jgi:hypothetical protein
VMKRSDLSTERLLRAVATYRTSAWGVLTDVFPPKVVLAAIEREVRAGRLEYGVWAGWPWLTPKGEAALLGATSLPDTPSGIMVFDVPRPACNTARSALTAVCPEAGIHGPDER